MTYIVLPAASDMHVHLRQDSLIETFAKSTSFCHRILVMPNTKPPILTGKDASDYKMAIQKHIPNVDVLTSIKLTSETTPKMIREASKMGVTAVKLYPVGVTTNSNDGIPFDWLDSPPTKFLDLIDCIKRSGMILCLHGEMPNFNVLECESEFLKFVDFLAFNFHRLRIVLEHISTRKQVEYVRHLAKRSKCDVGATITAHHLMMTIDDIVGSCIKPHNFCKPIAKTVDDREALRAAAMSKDPCFFLGSDSAPHSQWQKESSCGCAGCYTSPVLIQSLIEVFEEYGALDALPFFISYSGNKFYRCLDKDIPNQRYEKVGWVVPKKHGDVVIWRANDIIKWRQSSQ